jgi:dihydropyrimidinase
MHDLVIINGTCVTPQGTTEMDIGVNDGQIVQLATSNNEIEGHYKINATGKLVFPGFIDAHVHADLTLGEFSTTDGFPEVTRAAAHGGTTTVIPFAVPDPGETPLEAFDRRRREADGEAYVDYSLHGCVTSVSDQVLDELPELIERGAGSIKVFMVYRDRLRLTHGEIRSIMAATADAGGFVLVHAEDDELINHLVNEYTRRDAADFTAHPNTHPPVTEVAAMWTIFELVVETGCPTYFVHASTAGAQHVLTNARTRGLPLLSETCPHYLSLREEVYHRDDGEKFVCSPPVRPPKHGNELWQMIDANLITFVNSDHCGYNSNQKQQYRHDLTRIPNGLPGVETRNVVLYSEGVVSGRLTLEQFVELTSTNIARALGLYPCKGTIAIGTDADLVVFDPDADWIIDAGDLHMETDYSPFDGLHVKGRPETILVRGQPIVRNGSLVESARHGEYHPVRRNEISKRFWHSATSSFDSA